MVAVSKTIWTPNEQAAWAPPPDLRVSTHADRTRYIPYGAEPGPWRTERAPYTRALMDAYSDPEVEKITIAGPAQCSKTESVFNMLHYTVDVDPVPSMYVIAIDDEIETISVDRVLKNFQASPDLAVHLTGKAWDMKQSVFRFDRMSLYFTGAGSASALASKAIGRLFLDETDKYPDFVGSEGHPAKLAERRGTTFGDFKVVYLCTPTTRDGFILVNWHKSNRMKYHVPCLRCGQYQLLQFGNLKCKDITVRDPDKILTLGTHYQCPLCRGFIDSAEHPALIKRGVWTPEGCTVTPDGELTGPPLRSVRHSGFWITELLSPWIDWTKMLAEWFEIQAAGLEKQGQLKEFVNQVLGGPFEEPGQKIEADKIKRRMIPLPSRAVPTSARLLVSAADYHRDTRGNERVDFGVMAISPGFQCHAVLIDSVPTLDDYYHQVLAMPFAWAGDCDREDLSVTCAFVDSGDQTDRVYEWCRPLTGVVWPIKGIYGPRDPIHRKPIDKIMADAADPSRRAKSAFFQGMDLIEIRVDYFKDVAASLLGETAGQERQLTLHADTPDWFCQELTHEHKVRVKKGRYFEHTWVPVKAGLPVHGWDVLVYLMAAAYFCKANLMFADEQTRRVPAAIRQQMQQQHPEPPRGGRIKRTLRTHY